MRCLKYDIVYGLGKSDSEKCYKQCYKEIRKIIDEIRKESLNLIESEKHYHFPHDENEYKNGKGFRYHGSDIMTAHLAISL